MATGRHIQKKGQSNTTQTPATGMLKPRPFAEPAQTESATTPELQTQVESGQVGGDRLSRLDVSAPPPIQPKLTIGAPDDKFEQEADTIARKVVKQISAPTPPDAKGDGGSSVQRQMFSTPSIMRLTVQRREAIEGGEASSDLESSISQAKSGGSPLDNAIRPKMESAFGTDFSSVRVHTDANSDTLNRSISARAFTTGQHIFFKKGEYNPSHSGGQELIAHELTHVVQQNSSKVQPKLESTRIQRTPTVQNAPAVDPGKINQAAEYLREAMEGWGTDEDLIMRTLDNKTAAELAAIEEKYLEMYGRTLEYDLRDELSGKDLNQAMGYLSKAREENKAKVTGVEKKNDTQETKDLVNSQEMLQAADALYKAMEGWGTDEKTIMNTLRGKTLQQIDAIKRVYLDHYGRSLEHDLKDELSGKDLKEALAYLRADAAESAAKGLENSLSWLNDDEEKIEEILMSLPNKEIDALQTNHPETIKKVLSSLGGFDKKVVQALLAKNKPLAIAYRLQGAMKGAGTDEEAVQKYLKEHQTELPKIKAAYKNITNRDLETDIDSEFSDNWLTGAEKTLTKSLLETDPYTQAAARIYNAAYGSGTNEAAIYNEFKGKSKEECDKIKEAYDKNHGGEGAFQRMIHDEFSDLGWGKELTKVQQYSTDGKLDPVFALKDAMSGTGTNEEQIKEILGDKTKQEIEAIKARYKKEIGLDLETELKSELGGRDWHEVKLMLGGKPETMQEKWLVIKARYDFEIGGGSWAFSRWVMSSAQDLGFTTSKLQLEKQYARLQQIYDEKTGLKDGYTEQDFERVYNYTETDVKNYEEAKNAVTDAIVTGVNITAAIIATCLTAGTATPWLVAAVTAAGGAIGIAIKYGIQGDAYGVEDFGIDVVVVAVTAALAGLAESSSLADKLDEIGKVFGEKMAGQVLKEFTFGAIKGAANDSLIKVFETVLKSDKLRDSFLDALMEIGDEGLIAAYKAILKAGVGGLAGLKKGDKNFFEDWTQRLITGAAESSNAGYDYASSNTNYYGQPA
ncbi:eCIS core domain-containing protein [Laspinema olomoucense]|uniref:eCIS core domain-containing protein n=1 Tax=Laspinema olomoucense TaxID=3231600 RepID=UPI0021BB0349|nr:DUF4157 domain-containing protein [Laspinema sp. D3d]MCT7973038.1 DUF4157 domain-containing protein [Laspinema sp. D3d]